MFITAAIIIKVSQRPASVCFTLYTVSLSRNLIWGLKKTLSKRSLHGCQTYISRWSLMHVEHICTVQWTIACVLHILYMLLKSADQGVLLVPWVHSSTTQHKSFAFVGPLAWSDFPCKSRTDLNREGAYLASALNSHLWYVMLIEVHHRKDQYDFSQKFFKTRYEVFRVLLATTRAAHSGLSCNCYSGGGEVWPTSNGKNVSWEWNCISTVNLLYSDVQI